MQTVKVDKTWLISTIDANRAKHKGEYEKAFEGYRKEAIRVLEDNLAKFKSGNRTRLVWCESPPADHTKDYDRVMAMLEASVDDSIKLTAQDFQCYVQDDWGWKEMWMATNSKYLDLNK